MVCTYEVFEGIERWEDNVKGRQYIPSGTSNNGVLAVQTAHTDAVDSVRSRSARHLEGMLYHREVDYDLNEEKKSYISKMCLEYQKAERRFSLAQRRRAVAILSRMRRRRDEVFYLH